MKNDRQRMSLATARKGAGQILSKKTEMRAVILITLSGILLCLPLRGEIMMYGNEGPKSYSLTISAQNKVLVIFNAKSEYKRVTYEEAPRGLVSKVVVSSTRGDFPFAVKGDALIVMTSQGPRLFDARELLANLCELIRDGKANGDSLGELVARIGNPTP